MARVRVQIEIVDFDFEYQENVWDDKDPVSPLMIALANGHEGCVRLLLKSGANVNEGYPTALMNASEWGREGCVRLLLEFGANVNDYDKNVSLPSPKHTPWGSFHVVISLVSSLLSSEQRMVSFALRGIQRLPRDRQASSRRRRRGDSPNPERRHGHRIGKVEGPQRGRGPAERASVRRADGDRPWSLIAKRFRSGGGEAPSWAHADQG
jgi:hypothetical protein